MSFPNHRTTEPLQLLVIDGTAVARPLVTAAPLGLAVRDPGLPMSFTDLITWTLWPVRHAKIRRHKRKGLRLRSLATVLFAVALSTVASPASATTSLTSVAEPQCSSSKAFGGNYDASACVETISANSYRVTAYFANGADQPVDLTMKLSLTAGSSTYDLHTCSFQVDPRGNANCEGLRNFSQAPNGSIVGQVMFTSSGRSTSITTHTPSGAPGTVPAPSNPGSSTSDTVSSSQALTLVNQERAKAGCASLRVVQKLQTPAEQQSRDQAARDRDGHDGANGSTIDNRLMGLGYSRWAENVAQWQSAQEAVNFWLNSRSHRDAMLNCAFMETGLAVARSNSGKLYWTQTFGG